MGKLRVMGLEPAVEAHAVFAGRDVLRLDARHGQSARTMASPANSAPIESPTEAIR